MCVSVCECVCVGPMHDGFTTAGECRDWPIPQFLLPTLVPPGSVSQCSTPLSYKYPTGETRAHGEFGSGNASKHPWKERERGKIRTVDETISVYLCKTGLGSVSKERKQVGSESGSGAQVRTTGKDGEVGTEKSSVWPRQKCLLCSSSSAFQFQERHLEESFSFTLLPFKLHTVKFQLNFAVFVFLIYSSHIQHVGMLPQTLTPLLAAASLRENQL